MARVIPSALILEKNKLYTSGMFVELLEVQAAAGTVRLANNNDDVEWGGHTWTRFRFEPGDMAEGDDGDSQSVVIKVSNLAGTIQASVDADADNLIGDKTIYRLVHVDHPNEDPAIVGYFEIMEARADAEWMEFELGMENFFINRFPRNEYRRNLCRYQPHQTDVCVYAGSSACDRSFATCITLNRVTIFGGQPGIPGGVWSVTNPVSTESFAFMDGGGIDFKDGGGIDFKDY